MLDSLILSSANLRDYSIYTENGLDRVFPKRPFSRLKFAFKSKMHFRTLMANLFRSKKIIEVKEDMNLYEFGKNFMHFARPEDAEFFVNYYLDALQMTIYAGDIHRLSARSCQPFSGVYERMVDPNLKKEPYLAVHASILSIEKDIKAQRVSCFNFEEGLSKFIYKWKEYLENLDVKIIEDFATQIHEVEGKPIVKTSSGEELKFDKIISAVPSYELAKVLDSVPKTVFEEFEHVSCVAINVLNEKPVGLPGAGTLVPRINQQKITNCIYDYNLFPHLGNSVYIQAYKDKMEHPNDEEYIFRTLLEDFKAQTGVSLQPAKYHVINLENSLPQYNLGHFRRVQELEGLLPPWINICGQSFYQSGIPKCIHTAREVVKKAISNN